MKWRGEYSLSLELNLDSLFSVCVWGKWSLHSELRPGGKLVIRTALLTIWVNFLHNLLHLCLCGVEVECSEDITDLVRVDLSITSLVKQGECITEFCTEKRYCICYSKWARSLCPSPAKKVHFPQVQVFNGKVTWSPHLHQADFHQIWASQLSQGILGQMPGYPMMYMYIMYIARVAYQIQNTMDTSYARHNLC